MAEIARAEALTIYLSPADLEIDGDRVGIVGLIKIDCILEGTEKSCRRVGRARIVSQVERERGCQGRIQAEHEK